MSYLVVTAVAGLVGTVCGMSYSSDLTGEQWALLEPVFNAPGKRGPKHAPDLRRVVDAMLYVSHTGCQWRYLPESFGPWTRVWSQFRRWSRNGTWTLALTVLHVAAREADGRADVTPSMVVIDTHLARGYTSVTIEDLNVAGMLQLRALARYVSNAAFGQFRRQLEYKAAWYGTKVVVADRWFPSSKTCSGCGTINAALTLADRVYNCGACGLVIDRDVNAAVNLARYSSPPPPKASPLPAAA